EVRDEHDGPPAKPIRERAHDRGAEQLHALPHHDEGPEQDGALGGVAAYEARHQLGQDRDHDAEREHVERDRDEDEDERGLARRPPGPSNSLSASTPLMACCASPSGSASICLSSSSTALGLGVPYLIGDGAPLASARARPAPSLATNAKRTLSGS